MVDGFQCGCCGEFHEGLPLDYGAKYPDHYFTVPETERGERVDVTEDVCVIDNEFFFVRGVIEVPIPEIKDYFGWGVWCSLSERSFRRVIELWEAENVEDESPFFGWLNTFLPESIYPETVNLKTRVHLRNDHQRPFIELEPTDHPLAVEQRDGISMERAREIAEKLLHQDRF